MHRCPPSTHPSRQPFRPGTRTFWSPLLQAQERPPSWWRRSILIRIDYNSIAVALDFETRMSDPSNFHILTPPPEFCCRHFLSTAFIYHLFQCQSSAITTAANPGLNMSSIVMPSIGQASRLSYISYQGSSLHLFCVLTSSSKAHPSSVCIHGISTE